MAAAAQFTVERDHGHEGDAHGGKLAQAAAIVEPVGIDDGAGRRKGRLGGVVVEDDDLDAGLMGQTQGLEGRNAAVDGDDEARAPLAQREQRRGIGAITFLLPVGDVNHGRHAQRAEETHQQGR